MEHPEARELAQTDPKAFLAKAKALVILDEIQGVPELLSYLQVYIDESKQRCGQYVLIGSHQLVLREAITQSLAGRAALLDLLPFSISELKSANYSFKNAYQAICKGFSPRIYNQNQRPNIAYANHYQTYIERDVRQLINLKGVTLFKNFLRLLAGRAGQIMKYESLASDVGVDAKTIKHWLSILEASFIIYKLPPTLKILANASLSLQSIILLSLAYFVTC